jgi:4-amino-4-deoxy-L-arabinose transferase-like glycosyltransferase
LASILVIYLTFQLTRLLFNSRPTALFASLIIASNQELMTLGTRATPDALLCCFLLVSMFGFARIWFEPTPSRISVWLAIGGMALAVETKGLLGLSPLAANALFWSLAPARRSRARLLLHWPAIGVGVFIALSWYVLMLYQHGFHGMQQFLDDQVTQKVSLSPARVILNFLIYATAAFLPFVPWSVLAVFAFLRTRRELAGFVKQNRDVCIFLSCLLVILVIIFSFGNMLRTRYLLASYPMLAVLLASFIPIWMTKPGPERRLRQFLTLAAVIVAITGLAAFVFALKTGAPLLAAGVVLVILGATGIIATKAGQQSWTFGWMAAASILIFVITNASLRHAISPSELPGLAKTLRQMSGSPDDIKTWKVPDVDAAQLRLLSAGRLTLRELPLSGTEPDFSAAAMILTTSPNQQVLERAGFDLRRVELPNAGFSWTGLGAPFTRRTRSNKRLAATPEYWIAVSTAQAAASAQ